MRRATNAALFFSAAALLTGCSSQAPEITVTEAYVQERTDTDALVRVVIKAENHTSDSLPMWAIAYSDSQRGRGSETVERWAQATAPAGGTVLFELPVVVPAQASGSGSVGITATVGYVPGGKFRELLNELSVPLPTTSFSGTVPLDWSAPPRAAKQLRAGTAQTAVVTSPGPTNTVDTLPPLLPKQSK